MFVSKLRFYVFNTSLAFLNWEPVTSRGGGRGGSRAISLESQLITFARYETEGKIVA